MKGLLIKDFKLLKNQKNFLLIVLLMSVVMPFLNESASFVLGYITVLTPMLAVTTISYDELDKGFSFLFTLPISRKLYVWEKYLFGFLLSVLALGVAIIVTLILSAAGPLGTPWQDIAASPILLLISWLLICVMIPVQLKFGAEKSRLALILMGGGILILFFGLVQLLGLLGLDVMMVLGFFMELSPAVLILLGAAAAVLLFFSSVKISIHILTKKEF